MISRPLFTLVLSLVGLALVAPCLSEPATPTSTASTTTRQPGARFRWNYEFVRAQAHRPSFLTIDGDPISEGSLPSPAPWFCCALRRETSQLITAQRSWALLPHRAPRRTSASHPIPDDDCRDNHAIGSRRQTKSQRSGVEVCFWRSERRQNNDCGIAGDAQRTLQLL